MFSQIGWIPRQVEIRAEEKAEISERDEPHVGRRKDFFPGRREPRDGRRINGSIWADAPNESQLHPIDAFVVLRKVMVEKAEGNRPQHTQGTENVENRPPSKGQQNTAGDKRRDGYSEAAEEMRRALDPTALDARKPQLHAAAGNGKRAGFAQPQEEASAKQRTEAERRAGHHRRGGPQRHDDSQYALGTEAVTKPPGGHLTQRIGPCKGREDKAHGAFAETKLFGD